MTIMLHGLQGVDGGGAPGHDAFLDTIPEDQSVAQQRVSNLSAASAVASSDSDDGNEEDIENPQRQKTDRKKKSNRRHAPGSVASSDANAIIESGVEEPPESKPPQRPGDSQTVWTTRCVLFYTVLSLLVVGITVGIYFIVAGIDRDGEDDSADSAASGRYSGVPTPEFTIPPNFYVELDSESPSAAPSMNMNDIAEMDTVLLQISDEDTYFDPSTPQGICRDWLAHNDPMQVKVATVGAEAVQQRFILCVLFHSANGPTGWVGPNHECDWFGVSCDTGRVAVLYLAESNLTGTIPDELTHLSGLQLLSLGENNLRGSIPQGLLELPELLLIDLSSNQLTGTIPSTATSFTTTTNRYSPLEVLYLDDNIFEGTVPFFGDLERMRVQRNLFTGFDVGYATLTSLTSWKMYDNLLSGPLPAVWDLPYLFYLDLALNDWTGSIPDSLWNLPSLKSFVLHDARLTGTLPATTASDHFEYLWLHTNQLEGIIPSTLGLEWANLTEFLLHNNSFSGAVTEEQCNQWPALQRLETDCERAELTCACCTVCHP